MPPLSSPDVPIQPMMVPGGPMDLDTYANMVEQLLIGLDEEAIWELARTLWHLGKIKPDLDSYGRHMLETSGRFWEPGQPNLMAQQLPAPPGVFGTQMLLQQQQQQQQQLAPPGLSGGSTYDPYSANGQMPLAPPRPPGFMESPSLAPAAAEASQQPPPPPPPPSNAAPLPLPAAQLQTNGQGVHDAPAVSVEVSGGTASPADTPAQAEHSDGDSGDLPPAHHTPRDENEPPEDVIDSTGKTTLVLRNLPGHFTQSVTEEWLNKNGYQDKYDFLLWFPAKASTLHGKSYAFINFREVSDARHMLKKIHMYPIQTKAQYEQQDRADRINVAVAMVQGFSENFKRFRHLLDGETSSACKPFFAQEALRDVQGLPDTETKGTTMKYSKRNETWGTTLILRNLPPAVDTQELAREWLNKNGFTGRYDFFLFFPAKQAKTAGKKGSQNLAYCFVNFRTLEDAKQCMKRLDGLSAQVGDPTLNVVVCTKCQGKDQCLEHFGALESRRVAAWVDLNPPPPAPAPRPSFGFNQYQ